MGDPNGYSSERSTAFAQVAEEPDETSELSAILIQDGVSTTHALPRSGELIIGRGDDAGLRVEHPTISRRHARLILGSPVLLEDLGSRNGTSIRSSRLAPGEKVEVSPGVAIELGSVMLLLQRKRPELSSRPTAHPPRRLLRHDYFEIRLEEACAEAKAGRGTFSVVRIRVEELDRVEAARELLAGALGASDLFAVYGPRDLELFSAQKTKEATLALVGELQSLLAANGIRARFGIASFPADGRSPEDLLHRASVRAEGRMGDSRDPQIVVRDRVMLKLYELVERVAASNINVLLLGETGVGKEVLAEAVHRHSRRNEGELLKINCGAIPEGLLESELFGHEKGAFTGAISTKVGLLERAQGGTVFLDEVGELPLGAQVKLLRVIEDRRVLRIGGVEPIRIDVRFVSATNKNLEEEAARGRFRQDLYYRLNGISIVVPPLRERLGELPELVRLFADEAARELRLDARPELSDQAMGMLMRYSWPGNIRELRNVVERAVLLAGADPIGVEHLPGEKIDTSLRPSGSRPTVGATPRMPYGPEESGTDEIDPRAEAGSLGDGPHLEAGSPEWNEERKKIMEALAACVGNQTHAAKMLGISRRTLVSRMISHRIPRPRKPLPGTS